MATPGTALDAPFGDRIYRTNGGCSGGAGTLLASALTTAVMVPSGQEYTDTPVHAFLNRNPR